MSYTNAQFNKDDLLGTWHLSACIGRADDRSVVVPFSDHPEGMLVYNADGTMIVIIMNPDRPPFVSKDRAGGSDEEVRAAFEGFEAYCGRYVLDPEAGTATHHLDQSLYPNWIGTQQVRFVSLKDGQLSLSTPPILARGKEWRFYLDWKR